VRLALGLALAIALIAASGCARAAEPMSMAAFRDAYAAEVRHRRPDAKIEAIAPDQLSITLPGGAQLTAVLDNAYDHYLDQPSQLRSVLGSYVSATLESATPPTYTAAQLLVLVRPVSYAQAHAAMVASSPEAAKHGPLLTRPIAGELVAMVAVDEPTTYQFIPAATLRAELKLDDAAIWARALANTQRKLPTVPSDDDKDAVVTLETGMGLAASLLVEPANWDTPALQKDGPPVVAPVAKDIVFLTHLGDTRVVAAMRKAAAASVDDPDGLTTQLFVRRNGAWEVLPP
jgi:hypothetical protein